jgi:anthranilate synthase component 2
VGSALSGQVLVIDNYDSFTFNLVQYLRELGATVAVERNDTLSVAEISRRAPAAIVMSPGPRVPEEAGICVELVQELGDAIPMLGVCLGHQAIAVAYGAKVVRAPAVVHGKVGPVHHGGAGVLRGLDDPFMATRYHSLVVAEGGLPDVLEATAWSDDGLIMAMRHREFPVEGVQFHPESVGTPAGHALLRNFLDAAGVTPGPVHA